ncbi:hypothetical protein HN51_048153 [Arachis hypogaea]|uniref:DUF674 family protein n=1 Tax=Arachis hypogaea TaxID=3818 RepID=A0A445AJR6_ARAHY|nr:uncharacterized protein LOC107627594 [Arachis ipaensis]QHO24638.1 uncharacterized protein DS421_12g373960 [Arachis hypogaea]RYR26696.1 hypothetical protein Ahy_B02g060993 [Arachis hypogaea]
MASKLEQTLPLKLLVDRKKSCVVMAEASKDFIETLFSFLTLPLGTIIRLLSKNKLNGHEEAKVGCINNLYNSVENATDEVFWNPICKQMLLRPRNPCRALCRKLKLNVDDNEPTRRFICSNYCKRSNSFLLSAFSGVTCIKCGNPMDKKPKIMVNDSSSEVTHRHEDGVFIKGEAMYLIFDNLKVLQSSPRIFVKELVQLGYKDFNNLTEIYQNVGLKEVLDLLKQALSSKTALSDVFFANGFSKGMSTYSPKIGQTINHGRSDYRNLKVTVSKSKKKILHAEAEEDFVDFLLSFLTAPLGSVLKVLDGNASLGCMDNLYNSVKELISSWFFTAKIFSLLNPHVAPQFGFKKWQPLQIREKSACEYKYDDISGVLIPQLLVDINTKFYEPRSPDGQKEVGFVRRPSVFVVWDDLRVIPMANASSISFMQKMNIPFDDLEEHVITIGNAEALNLLGASLTTNAALTEGLFYLLEMPNQDARA